MASMSLSIVSPSGVLASEEVSRIRVWTPSGQVELLPGHCLYIGLVSTGMLEAESTTGGRKIQYSIGEGTIECEHNKVTVLVDRIS